MDMLKKKLLFLPILLMVVALALPLVAQEQFGNISGTVTDPSGAVVPGVKVTVTNRDTKRALTTTSRDDGSFAVTDIDPGRYSVSFEKTGFSRQEASNAIVLVGKTTRVNAALTMGSVATTVEVSGAAEVIDTSSTTLSANVTAEELELLPKGRTFEGAALFSPSVNTGFTDGGYQINGASAAENAYYIDGVSVNSVIDGSARQTSTFDYLQEVQVKTTGLDAEYGGALGGVVSAVTKSGGNAFHGDGHFYYFGNSISAAPAKRIAIDRSVATPGPYPVGYFQDGKFENNNFEAGGSLGGPIWKDKLWFYTAASPRWLRRTQEYQFSDGPDTMHRKAHYMNWFNKLSWNPTDKIRANFAWLYTPQYLTGTLFGYDNIGPNSSVRTLETAAGSKNLGYYQSENSLTGQVDFTITNTSILSVRGGRYRLNYVDTGIEETKQYVWSGSSQGIPGVPAEWQQPDGSATPSAAQTSHDLTTRTYIQADLSQLFKLGGQHTMKFGFGTTKNVNNVLDSSAPDGIVTLFLGLDTGDPATTPSCGQCINAGTPQAEARGTYGYYTVDQRGTIGTAGSNITHLYVQDSWKLLRRLTINAGVRFEKETIPSFRPDIQKYAIQFGYGDKIAPRIGASFDLLGNGKVKLSGGWGRYYDWTKYDLPRGTFGGDFWWTYYRALDDPNVIGDISLANMPGANIFPADHVDWRLPGFEFLDPGVKPMSSDSLNAGVEWEVAPSMVFTGRYVRSKLNRTIEDLGVLVGGSEQYFYGNPGEGQNKESPSCYQGGVATCAIPMPKATRKYDAMELSLSRRFTHGYLFNASYTYSRLWGNYAGIQNTDEILPSTYGAAYTGNQSFFGQTYRPGGNASRAFDQDQIMFDAHGHIGVFGRLATDRPHVFKFYGAKEFKWGTEVGGFFRLQSGTPVTTQAWSTQSIGMYVEGRGDLGREPVFSQTDLMVAHTVKLGETKSLRFEFNMINLFNQKAGVYTYEFYNRRDHRTTTGMQMDGVDLRNGFDWQGLVAAGGNDLDPRYNQQSEFNPGFAGRFLVKFTF